MTPLEQRMFALLKRAFSEMKYARWESTKAQSSPGRGRIYADLKALLEELSV